MASVADAFRGMLSSEELTLLINTMEAERERGVTEEVASGPLAVQAHLSLLDITDTKNFTIGDGTREGQRKAVRVASVSGTPVGTITPASFGDGSSISASAVGHEFELVWFGGVWRVARSAGVTINP